ncbi:MAG: protein kinase, partial [Planctomycetota bacterium]
MEGTKLAHYEVLSRLGAGGMGEVWLARDTRLEREVALKFLHAALGLDEEAEQRLLREARAASSLQHPGILTVHAIEKVEGRSFVVMERLRGASIDEACQGLERSEILRLVSEVADALAAAHAQGIIHRDIKPSNLFVNDRGQAIVMDFGLARVQDEPQLTRSGSTIGTLGYTAPEQLVGREVGPGADVFSLGVVLYELLGDTRAFDRGQGMAGVIHDVLEKDLAPLSSEGEALNGVLARALAKDPAERYASAEEFRDALKSVSEELPGTDDSAARSAVGSGEREKRPGLGLIAPLVLGALWFGGLGFFGLWAIRSCGAEDPPADRKGSSKSASDVQERSDVIGPRWKQQNLNLFVDRAETPSLSPDGQALAFVSEDAAGVPQIFVADVEDPSPRQLTYFEEGASAPRWSPEGGWILASRGARSVSLSQPAPPAYSVPILGGEPRALMDGAKNASFGSGGREIIFERRGQLFIYDIETTETSSVAIASSSSGAAALFDRFPALSPDGQLVAYVRTTLGPLGLIDVLDRATGEQRTLVDQRARHADLAFSEDGSELLFSSDMGGAANLWSVHLATGAPRQVTQGAGDDIAPSMA